MTTREGYQELVEYVQTKSNVNVKQLGEALMHLEIDPESFNIKFEELVAAVLILAESGIKGSLAGQPLAVSFRRLLKPTEKMVRVINDLDLGFYHVEGNLKSIANIISELEEKMDHMATKEKALTLSTLFGADAVKHWATLIESGSKNIEENSKLLTMALGVGAITAYTAGLAAESFQRIVPPTS